MAETILQFKSLLVFNLQDRLTRHATLEEIILWADHYRNPHPLPTQLRTNHHARILQISTTSTDPNSKRIVTYQVGQSYYTFIVNGSHDPNPLFCCVAKKLATISREDNVVLRNIYMQREQAGDNVHWYDLPDCQYEVDSGNNETTQRSLNMDHLIQIKKEIFGNLENQMDTTEKCFASFIDKTLKNSKPKSK